MITLKNKLHQELEQFKEITQEGLINAVGFCAEEAGFYIEVLADNEVITYYSSKLGKCVVFDDFNLLDSELSCVDVILEWVAGVRDEIMAFEDKLIQL